MSNTAPSRADPVVVFPLSQWCPPQETSQPHPPHPMLWEDAACAISGYVTNIHNHSNSKSDNLGWRNQWALHILCTFTETVLTYQYFCYDQHTSIPMVILIPQCPVKFTAMFNECTTAKLNVHEKQHRTHQWRYINEAAILQKTAWQKICFHGSVI